MDLFYVIGISWVIGMAGYIIFSSKNEESKRNCNVRKEIIKFKKVNNQINKALNNR